MRQPEPVQEKKYTLPAKPISYDNQVPAQLETCPVCLAQFRSIELLIEHSAVHQEQSLPTGKEEAKKETAKCPECFKRFAIEELPKHMQDDHFIY